MANTFKQVKGLTFQVISPTSAKGRALLASAEHYKAGDIYEAYERPSVYKVRAWRDILAFSADIKAQAVYITGANCSQYSAVTIKQTSTGREVYYFTAYNNYLIIE